MPRPRKDPDAVLEREIRITPPNGKPIEDWHIDDTIQKLVVFQEGGEGTPKKLHYHGIIKTTMTSQALPKWIYMVADCIQTGERGNAVFFTRAIHSGSQGYISKNKCLTIRHGETQTTIEEWFKQSDDYVKQRGAQRKREQRTRQDELREIIDEVKKDLKQASICRSVDDVVHAILKYCNHAEVRFPTRTQMETFVVELLYPYDHNLIKQYYVRSFPNIF